MDHLHKILENTPGHVRPGNQVDADSFLTARNQEIQALLKEIRKSLFIRLSIHFKSQLIAYSLYIV
jgi:hypothetical protein